MTKIQAIVDTHENHITVRDAESEEIIINPNWRHVNTRFHLCNRCLWKNHYGEYDTETDLFECNFYVGETLRGRFLICE